MQSGSESDVKQGIKLILDRIAPGRFDCAERKGRGTSAINKPVDLHITKSGKPDKVVLCIEVANVNTTQLVGETCRLYYDECPLKILILGNRNIPTDGKKQCEKLLARQYGQDDIRKTPARIALYNEDDLIETALRELLLIDFYVEANELLQPIAVKSGSG